MPSRTTRIACAALLATAAIHAAAIPAKEDGQAVHFERQLQTTSSEVIHYEITTTEPSPALTAANSLITSIERSTDAGGQIVTITAVITSTRAASAAKASTSHHPSSTGMKVGPKIAAILVPIVFVLLLCVSTGLDALLQKTLL